MKIDVIIPTYKPDEGFIKLLWKISEQETRVNRVIVMNTEEELWKCDMPSALSEKLAVDVFHITKEEFDHGKTRHEAIMKSDADICVLMTQDAMPADSRLIGELIKPLIENEQVAVSYGRQLAHENSGPVEKLTREFNYPDEDMIKGIEDVERLQIKAFFCSNVCSAYKRDIFTALNGFVQKTIFNEDMLFAAKAQKAGYKVAYCSKARVYHSHEYTALQQYKRNFDNGVSHAEHPEVFDGIGQDGEGLKMVKTVISRLVSQKQMIKIPGYIWQTGWKYIGFKLGCRYKRLPGWFVMVSTSDKSYFM